MAIILGGNGVDGILTIGPNINTDGLVFNIDPADTTSLITKGNVPLVDGVEVDYIYGQLGDGQIVKFTGTTGFPYYKVDKGGYLYLGQGDSQNILGTLSNEVVLGHTYTLDLWVSPKKYGSNRGMDWLTGRDLAPASNASGRSILAEITNDTIGTDNYNSVAAAIPIGTWANVTIIVTPQTATYYVNGAFRGVGTKTYTKTALDIRLQFISSPAYAQGGGETDLGPVKAYDRALGAQEVVQNYNAIKSRYTI